jgi:hypothetical protein
MFAENQFYGHAAALQQHAGVSSSAAIPGRLQHGWHVDAGFWPEQLKRRFRFFVWSAHNAWWARRLGGRRVDAVGSPFLYMTQHLAPKPATGRRLLFGPFHSAHKASLDAGATPVSEQIRFLRDQGFDDITICAYWYDWENPDTRASYEREGVSVVTNGKRDDDGAFLWRLVANVQAHDIVATDRLSTATFYALALGRPVFQFGRVPGIKEGPDPDGSVCAAMQRERFPELMWDRFDGTCHRDTGLRELGADQMRTPEELRELFHWEVGSRWRGAAEWCAIRAEKLVVGRYYEVRERLTGTPIPGWL